MADVVNQLRDVNLRVLCCVCPALTFTVNVYKEHMKHMHPPTLPCPVCDSTLKLWTFKSFDTLLEENHTLGSLVVCFKCPTCHTPLGDHRFVPLVRDCVGICPQFYQVFLDKRLNRCERSLRYGKFVSERFANILDALEAIHNGPAPAQVLDERYRVLLRNVKELQEANTQLQATFITGEPVQDAPIVDDSEDLQDDPTGSQDSGSSGFDDWLVVIADVDILRTSQTAAGALGEDDVESGVGSDRSERGSSVEVEVEVEGEGED